MGSERQDRLLRERNHDTYKLDSKLKGPAHCPRCGLNFHAGRWQRLDQTPADSSPHTCSACQRILDQYPAGEVTLTGAFALGHADEILRQVHNTETAETAEHPLNRIMAIVQSDEEILITTTDLHLPARIGKAIERAYEGQLDIHFDEAGHFTRVRWHRED